MMKIQAEWHLLGSQLVQEIKVIAKLSPVAQVLVVWDAHDPLKYRFPENVGLTLALEWYVTSIL